MSMTDVEVRATAFDDDAADALREILADPSLPVGTTLSGNPKSSNPDADGRRIAALREAHDYLVSRRIAATALESDSAAATLIAELKRIDPALAATVRWHAVLVPVIASLPASRARNAVLGDVSRGELLTWAPTTRSWAWTGGQPVAKVEADIEVDEFPGLYDAVLTWQPEVGLVVIPTHRDRVSWEPADSGLWSVRLAHATLHIDEVIALETDPRTLASWRQEN
jgi:hypothetical protein